MKTIQVTLKKQVDDSYPIYIQEGLLQSVPTMLTTEPYKNDKVLIVTDSNVNSLYGDNFLDLMKSSGFNSYLFSFQAGEESKNIETKLNIEQFMFENNFGRDSVIIALGGGVVGDIAGFTASTFNRGIPYIQIPTTIVSQVDSSIGGKTAIDVPYGKNLIGTFYQPNKVFIDPTVLNTLPDKEFFSGIGEIIKHAVIQDQSLFSRLKEKKESVINKDMAILTDIIENNCQIKRKVVELDEKEGNLRKILNYGHTIGHAIEKLTDYKMLHGECVAIGMLVEAEMSNQLNYMGSEQIDQIKNLIENYNLPTQIPKGLSPDSIYKATLLDKKSIQNEPRYTIPYDIGEMLQIKNQYGITIDKSIVFKSIEKYTT